MTIGTNVSEIKILLDVFGVRFVPLRFFLMGFAAMYAPHLFYSSPIFWREFEEKTPRKCTRIFPVLEGLS